MVSVLGRGTVLVVDGDAARAAKVSETVSAGGYMAISEPSGRSALRRVSSRSVNVLAVSADLPDMDMTTFLESLRRANLAAGVFIYGRSISAEDAVAWMKSGAVDILLDVENAQAVRDAVSRSFTMSARSFVEAASQSEEKPEQAFLYRTRSMEELMTKVRRVAPVKATVLITGESGTGKDVLARQIHILSGRRGLYLALNCAAIPETLLEDELFGHEKGAFTGADRMREGRFEAAAGGTLLLDEIGEIPAATQVKLLRALEEEKVTRLGGNTPVPTDVRLIAATNSDLMGRVREGVFREDLFYRLKVVELHIPPLRARKQDIPLLVMAFLRQSAEKHGLSIPLIEQDALQAMISYSWPGNVRQLRNLVESMLITSGERIAASDLPAEITGVSASGTAKIELDLPMTMDEIEDVVIDKTLEITGGNRTRAAELLGLGRRTLQRRLGGSG